MGNDDSNQEAGEAFSSSFATRPSVSNNNIAPR